jgi:hypothetical protein
MPKKNDMPITDEDIQKALNDANNGINRDEFFNKLKDSNIKEFVKKNPDQKMTFYKYLPISQKLIETFHQMINDSKKTGNAKEVKEAINFFKLRYKEFTKNNSSKAIQTMNDILITKGIIYYANDYPDLVENIYKHSSAPKEQILKDAYENCLRSHLSKEDNRIKETTSLFNRLYKSLCNKNDFKTILNIDGQLIQQTEEFVKAVSPSNTDQDALKNIKNTYIENILGRAQKARYDSMGGRDDYAVYCLKVADSVIDKLQGFTLDQKEFLRDTLVEHLKANNNLQKARREKVTDKIRPVGGESDPMTDLSRLTDKLVIGLSEAFNNEDFQTSLKKAIKEDKKLKELEAKKDYSKKPTHSIGEIIGHVIDKILGRTGKKLDKEINKVKSELTNFTKQYSTASDKPIGQYIRKVTEKKIYFSDDEGKKMNPGKPGSSKSK